MKWNGKYNVNYDAYTYDGSDENAMAYFFGETRPPVNIEDIMPYYNNKIMGMIDEHIEVCLAEDSALSIDEIMYDLPIDEIKEEAWEHFCAEDYHYFDSIYDDGTPDPMPAPVWEDD